MKHSPKDVLMLTALSVATLGVLAGCQRQAPTDEANATAPAPAATAEPATAAPAYQPPTAEQLYALVSPIALFPDKLVALTLAASTHPDDVHAARGFLEDKRNLSGSALIDAADDEPWDPSVKALVAFPAVVDQLDGHGDWTAALGAAYAAEPTDVLNAIQVMRQRARAHGSLKDTPQQTIRVTETPAPTTVVEERRVVEAPAQTIEIEPAQSDVVYVPSYDPDVVYGEPVYSRVYTTERWYEPAPDRGALVATGLLSFGAGVLVGELFAHGHHDHPWGWDAWRTSWGGPRGGGYGRPAVVYDNHPYVVNRTTVIQRYTHIDRSVHIDNRHDFGNVSVHNTIERGAPAPAPGRFAAPAAAPRPVDFAHMQRPNFSPAMMHATAPNGRPALPAPGAERAAFAAHAANEPGRPAEAHAPAAGRPMEPGRPPAFDPATAQRHDRPSPTPAAAPRQDVRDDAHMPPRDTRLAQHAAPPADPGLAHREEPRTEPRAATRVEQHMEPRAQLHMEPRMEQHMEQHAQPHMEPHAPQHMEARPEQHQASRPAPHHDDHRQPAHEDKHDH